VIELWQAAVATFGITLTLVGLATALSLFIVCLVAMYRNLPRMPDVEIGHYLNLRFNHDSPPSTRVDRDVLPAPASQAARPAPANQAALLAPASQVALPAPASQAALPAPANQMQLPAQRANYPFRKFGEELKLVRLLHRVTTHGLAEALDCTVTYMSEIELGKFLPSDDEFAKIIQRLNLNKDEVARLIRRMR
jgi:hypothetical protein